MHELDFLSYADVHRTIVATLPIIRRFPIAAVTYVPRGGGLIAGILVQLLDVPLIGGSDLGRIDLTRCLLVDDMIVTGRSLAAFRRAFLPDRRDVPTYVFASVPRERPDDASVDVVSITVDPERYFLLPWEIGDIFRPSFPFPILVELDGVVRGPSPVESALLSTPRSIAHLVSFGTDPAEDRDWLTGQGYHYQRLTRLRDADQTDKLADLVRRDGVRLYLGSDAGRCVRIKKLCPECHVIVFPEMVEARAP